MGTWVQNTKMKCPICKHGETQPGQASVTLSKPGGATIVFKDVPAQVCNNCGEEYVDEAVTSELLRQAAEAANAGVQVEVRSYLAA
jgi:YgiT-type zinc finger domain-containing protein